MSFTPFSPFRGFGGGGAVLSLDPDAAAYIAALETAGATVSPTQSAAIDAFIVAEKAGSRWDLIKRLYLPIWALEAPNAICMRSLTSGSFPNGMTHSAGYIQGNGTTQYFDPGAAGNLRSLGMSGANLHYMAGILLGATGAKIIVGAWDGVAARRCQLTDETTLNRFAVPALDNSASPSNNDTARTGILVGSATGIAARYLHRRKTAGTTVVNNTVSEDREIPDCQPFILNRNDNGTPHPSLAFNGRLFAASYGLAIPQSDAADYSANLKTLWETCTGLTLP